MLISLEEAIGAAIPDWPALAPSDRAEVFAHCVGFIRAQLRLAPLHIRAGFIVLFAAYVIYTLFRAGPYAARPACGAALTTFSALPLPMVAGLERVLRSMTLLAFFEEPIVLASLGEDTPAKRQATFRIRRAELEGTPS